MAILHPLLWRTAAPGVPKAPAPAWALPVSQACSWQAKMSACAQSNQTQTLVGNVSHTSCEPKTRTHLVVVHTRSHDCECPFIEVPIASPAHTCAQIRTCLHRNKAQALQHRVSRSEAWIALSGCQSLIRPCVSGV